MAIVKFGGGVTGLRGQIGGNIFSANSNGAYVRSWANIPNPQTVAQTFRRLPMQNLPGAWWSLSAGQRSDWNDYGQAHPKTNALGETYYATGWQWFVGCNQNLNLWGGSPVTDAPVNPPPVQVNCNDLHYQPNGLFGDVAVYFDNLAFAGVWQIISAFVVPTGAVASWNSTYYFMRASWDIGDGDLSVNFGLNHDLKFGEPQEGWTCFCRVHTGDAQGLVTGPWQDNATWPAP